MRAKPLQVNYSELLFALGFCTGFVGLFFSPFVASLGTALLLVSVLANSKGLVAIPRAYLVLYLMPVALVLTDFLRPGDSAIVQSKLLLMLGFASIAIASYQHRYFFREKRHYFFVLCFTAVFVVNAASLINYFSNKEALDVLLLQSKSIPVFGGMHHIHFGIINALAIGILLYYILHKAYKRYTVVLVLLCIFILFSFHILSSRTGLLSLYSSLVTVLLVYSLVERTYKQALYGLLLLAAVNGAALLFSTSFKNKIANSVEDVQSWENPESVNYKSMGMRLEAYRMSLLLFADNPLFGVGSGQADQSLQDYYEKEQTALYKENRVGPHNQVLEFAVKYGLFGILYMIWFYGFWLQNGLRPMNYGLLVLVLVIIISSQFESLFERQVSVFITACILPLSSGLFEQEN